MTIPSTTYQLQSTDLNLTDVLQIDGTLELDPRTSVTITTTKNIIVTGKLISHPNPGVNHLINFVKIDESKFVGGGDTVLDSDIGLWVTGAGQLDLQGSYISLGSDYDPESKTFVNDITEAMAGYQPNLRIEGTATGQSHIFIKSSKPQTFKNVQFRYMGPRKDTTGDGIKEIVLGRYACHFHHCEEGSRGSIIEGCIARDCNSHCFVPHGSHGITMRSNFVTKVLEAPFWYDPGHKTNDLIWEHNTVINVGFIPRAADQDTGGPQGGVNGFLLGFGDGNICRGNVVVGTTGDYRAAGAYNWPELRDDNDASKDLTSSWLFEDNIAIDCPSGDEVWQNSEHYHIITGSVYINCDVPFYHGAYSNDYARYNCRYIGGTSEVWAASDSTRRILFVNCTFDAQGADYCVVINEGPGVGALPIMFRNCRFLNFGKKAILNQNPGAGVKHVDVVDCGLPATAYQVSSKAISGEWIRVQEQGKAWKITKSGTTSIALFAPTMWGTGTGLKAEYFKLIPSTGATQGPTFGDKVMEREEPTVNVFDLTHPQIHYAVPAAYGAQWSGKIQPQYSQTYTFYSQCGGGLKLSVGGKSIIDTWDEQYPGDIKSTSISLEAGKLYDVKLEYFNLDERSKCTLEWTCPSLPREFVPMSQLYPGEIAPPIDNKAPMADAGVDQKIEVSTILYGTGKDPEGGALIYKWEQTKGVPAVIATPGAATTKVTGLSPGENIFRLTVTDEKGASGSDETVVMVG